MGITTAGKDNVAKLIGANTTGTAYTVGALGIGTSNTAFDPAQTDLIAGGVYSAYSAQTETSQTLTTTKATWSPGAGSYYEVGLFKDAANHANYMVCRQVITLVTLGASDTITLTITVAVS